MDNIPPICLADEITAWAAAVAASFDEFLGYAPGAVDVRDIRSAYLFLAAPRPGDNGPTATRRLTCGAIAAALGRAAGFAPGNAGAAIPVWRAAAEALQAKGDPRLAAMAATFAREADELSAA